MCGIYQLYMMFSKKDSKKFIRFASKREIIFTVCVKVIRCVLLCITPDRYITPYLSLIFSNVTVGWHESLMLTAYSNINTHA